MLKRGFIPYIVGGCIVAFIFTFYVTYREYQGYVKLKTDLSDAQAFNRSIEGQHDHSSYDAAHHGEGAPVASDSEKTGAIESKATVPPTAVESADDFLAELSDEEIALLTTEVVEETQPVSSFGFGPYPEVPSDYPEDVIWEEDMDENISQFGSEAMKAAELMDRILIKLWNQGHRATSASMENGLVYPSFSNTVYVRWEYFEEEDGRTSRYAESISGGEGVSDRDYDDLGEGIIPAGITVLDYDSDAIDPYTFLNLNQ